MKNPLGATLPEAEHLMRVQQETKGFLQIGFKLHYSTLRRRTKEWIGAGLIGDAVNVPCR